MRIHELSITMAMAFASVTGQTLTNPLVKIADCPEPPRIPMEINKQTFSTLKHPGTIQGELPPQKSVDCAQTPPDLKAEIWASEQHAGNIKALQAFAFDERGRLWAVETFDYPNTITDPFQGHDRIVILEDTDRNGAVDKSTVFVSGLNIPQGIEIVPQGVAVALSPYVVLFEDKDGDDKADSPTGKILYQGFIKLGDTHGGISSLRYGLDNWLYGSSGYNKGTVLGKPVHEGQWRVKLDGSAFEQVGNTTANTWGTGFNEEGQGFGSCANGCGHTQHTPVPGQSSVRISSYGEKIMAITEDILQATLPGGFTATTDHEIYSARLLPQRYWNRAALVSEGTGHLVNQAFLQPSGSTWKAVRDSTQPNIFASKDAWTAPIMSKTGPDGAVWILDWHNYLFLHNGAAPTGPGGAYRHDILRIKTGSRIFRLLPKDGRSEPVLNLRNASLEQLVATFRNTNMFWRITAQKLILRNAVSTEAKTRVEALLTDALTRSRSKDATDNDPYALHALWTAHGLGLIEANPGKWIPILKDLLLHPASGVRQNIPKAMPRTTAAAAAIRDQGRVNDPNPHVRLQTLLALGEMPNTAGISMFKDYRMLDAHSQAAFARAESGAGIAEAATLPAVPGLQPVSLVPGSGPSDPWVEGALHFRRGGNGEWGIAADANFPPGRLLLYSMKGRRLAESAYDGRVWSSSLGRVDGQPRVYIFQALDGRKLQGVVAPSLGRW